MTTISDRPAGETDEARIAKALAHPLRARILERLGERVLSPGDLATEIGASLGVVSYHVRMLRDYECVELVRTEPRRGALQHFYKAIARPNLDEGQWSRLPEAVRSDLVSEGMRVLVDDVAYAGICGTLADEQTRTLTASLELDERARAKVNRLLGRTLEQIHAIGAESASRDSQKIRTKVALLHFERGVEIPS